MKGDRPGQPAARSIRPGAREAIARAAAELAAVPPFSDLAPVDRAKLAAALEEATFAPGEVIFAEGSSPDALYILREGLVEREAEGVRLDTLQPPAVFGDLALLRHEPRATTLVTASPVVVWRLPADRFARLLNRTPGIAARFAAAVSGRLASRQREIAELAQDFEGLAERVYSTLTPAEQRTFEQLALAPTLDARLLEALAGTRDPDALPLGGLLLHEAPDGRAGGVAFPPTFRRFLLRRAEEQLGAAGIANARREVAATARAAGLPDLSIQVLVDGGLVAEAAELAEREVDGLRRQGRLTEACRLVEVLPSSALAEHPRLQELTARPTEAPERPTTAEPAPPWFARRPGPALIGSLVALAIIGSAWLTPAPAGLTLQGWRALATLLGIVPLLALEVLPEGIVALALAGAWVIGGVAEPRVALGGFATGSWVLVVSTLAVGTAIASSGLLYRLALWTVASARGGFAGQVIGLLLAGLAVGPAIPNATSRVALIAPAVTELIDALGYPPGSRAAVGLAMAVLMGFGQLVGAFLTSSTTAVLVYAVLPETTRAAVSWGGWAARAAPTHVLLLVGLAGAILWLYGRRPPTEPAPAAAPAAGDPVPGAPSLPAREASLALQRALLGPLSRQERIALVVTILLLIGFTTQPLHHLDAAWIGVVALAALAATGVLPTNGLASVNWSFVLLFGVLTSMSDVFGSTGLDRWFAAGATGTLSGLTGIPVVFVAVLTLLCFALSLVLRWQAVAPLLTLALAPVAASAQIDPWIVGMIALIGCNGFFLPYQSTTYLALYHGSGGRAFSHSQARPMAIAYALVVLLSLCASVPAWRALGLIGA